MLAASPHERERLNVRSLGATFWLSMNKETCVGSRTDSVTEINKILSLDRRLKFIYVRIIGTWCFLSGHQVLVKVPITYE